jgi:predicted NBD/HSP70 family sugar kinase
MTASMTERQAIPSSFLRRPTYDAASANERGILDLVRRDSGLSRADLARLTGLTNQSISRIVGELIDRGLLELSAETVIRGRGQPAAPVLLRPDAVYTLGVSLMTDTVALGLMNFAGVVIETAAIAPPSMAIETVLDVVRGFINDSFGRLGLDRRRLLGAGVGVTGYFVGEGARVNPPAGLDDWALIDLVAVFGDGLGLPVWVDNDGNVAAVGEGLNGVGRWAGSFAYLYFATGFGGGLVVDGRPFRGAHGNAGEFASVLPPDYVSPSLERLRLLVGEAGRPFASLGEMLAVFDPAWQGVEPWLDEAQQSLGLIISAISAVADPQAIVLGGRLPHSLVQILSARLTYFNPPRRAHPRPTPRLVGSEVRGDAAVIGAAAMPLRALFFD